MLQRGEPRQRTGSTSSPPPFPGGKRPVNCAKAPIYQSFLISDRTGMVNRVELTTMISEVIRHSIEAGEPPFDEWAQAAHIPDRSIREVL
ncbi:hypothetical protein PQG02_36780 (plasmid) [Nostoc sp. UHCC 0926]|uniref:hypothetical protein n=1 Tax=Nostoc sp. UHCC 0926 TaxID=3025190 RepID=UPI002360EF5E|nr:hypothetical protein [Nostoc sp. UHCC 0926]WDD36662.1 hypothetical protein PQG02_36780 [Nostoc sp. UHCC 0926]